MSEAIAQGEVKDITVEAIVTRADGTVEDHGVVAEWHRDDPDKNKGSVVVAISENLRKLIKR